jgi:Mg-chelatase subunit ChlD
VNALRILVASLAAAAIAAAALAGDVLTDWQKRYTKDAYASQKLEVANALADTGKPDALKALQQCTVISKAAIEDFRKDSEKLRVKLAPVEAKIAEKEANYLEQQRKQGNPNPTSRPRFPEDDEFQQIRSELDNADRRIASEIAVLGDVLDAHGRLVGKLPPDAQKAVRDDWTKNRLASKDWGVRAECYELVGHTQTDWATEMLVAAVSPATGTETDPRALVVAVDGLAKRDPAKVVPALAARLDDVRWLVRVAVVKALEDTPAKEGIDAIVKRMVKEDGRLKADCARALTALTGQQIPANPEMWRIWWEANRDKWTGKPPKDAAPSPLGNIAQTDPAASKQTGFFGIEVESRRVVFVIDISGSMATAMGGTGPDAKKSRAETAKAELTRVLGALEDGAQFNMVFFSSAVKVWKSEMTKADAKTRKEAQDYVAAIQIGGGTNTYDALEAAFGLGDMGKGKKKESDPTGDARVDTIVFLSDGKPTQGRTTDPDAIRTAVREWNRARRIAIHTVAFGAIKKEGQDGADPQFMKSLADDTGGTAVVK